MATIEGYPEGSMHGQYLKWGRANKYAPSFVFDGDSEAAIRGVQEDLKAKFPDTNVADELHATILYCPPRTLFEAVQHITGWENPSVESEVRFYSDVANGFETGMLFSVESVEMPVEGIETFDQAHGLVVLKLAKTALLSKWRENVVELLHYNLREYYGVSPAQFDALAEYPTFAWLFRPSHPHVTLGTNIHTSDTELQGIPLPESLTLGGIKPKSPVDFIGFNSLRFDPDAAYEAEYGSA